MSEKIDRDISTICRHIAAKGGQEANYAWGRILIEWHQMRTPPDVRPVALQKKENP